MEKLNKELFKLVKSSFVEMPGGAQPVAGAGQMTQGMAAGGFAPPGDPAAGGMPMGGDPMAGGMPMGGDPMAGGMPMEEPIPQEPMVTMTPEQLIQLIQAIKGDEKKVDKKGDMSGVSAKLDQLLNALGMPQTQTV